MGRESASNDDAGEISDVAAVRQELRIHQVELELQNDEILRANADLVDARDRYRQLFDCSRPRR